MVSVWDVQREDAFLHVKFWKSLSDFTSLFIFHCYDGVSPRKILFGERFFIIKSCRFGFKSVFEEMFSCFASIFVLIADK